MVTLWCPSDAKLGSLGMLATAHTYWLYLTDKGMKELVIVKIC